MVKTVPEPQLPRLLKDASRDAWGKRALIAAASELFAERGYENTSLHDICAMVGKNAALVKYHFGSKEGLYKAVAEHLFETDLSGFLTLSGEVTDDASWRAAVRGWIERALTITSLVGAEEGYGLTPKVIAREFCSPSPVHAEIKARFYQPLRTEFRRLVRLGLPPGDDPALEAEASLWCSALGSICFSHAAVIPSWGDLYRPSDVGCHDWLKREIDWFSGLLFSRLSYQGRILNNPNPNN